MELVKCNNLCKKFDDKQVLNNINLSIPKGKIIGLLGKNGMGKTTLIKLINDLLTPTSGEVLINGEKPGVNSKKIISYLPERTYLDKNMNVSQIITFFNEFYDNFNEEKAIKLLKDLDLDINLKINKMSKRKNINVEKYQKNNPFITKIDHSSHFYCDLFIKMIGFVLEIAQ